MSLLQWHIHKKYSALLSLKDIKNGLWFGKTTSQKSQRYIIQFNLFGVNLINDLLI